MFKKISLRGPQRFLLCRISKTLEEEHYLSVIRHHLNFCTDNSVVIVWGGDRETKWLWEINMIFKNSIHKNNNNDTSCVRRSLTSRFLTMCQSVYHQLCYNEPLRS